MVSADGESVTPEDSDPRGDTPTETKTDMSGTSREVIDSAMAESPRDDAPQETAVAETAVAEVVPDQNGVTSKPQKRKKLSRKQKKISRLVMEFQPDAVEMEHRKVAGGLRWTLYVVILMLISTLAWSWWARVDRVVTAEGKIIATETVIKAPLASPIRSIEAEFGDTVRAGEVLVTFDPTFSEADVSKLEAQENSLLAKLQRLQAEQSKTDFLVTGHEDDPVWLTERKAFGDRQRQEYAIVERYNAETRKLEATKARNIAEVESNENLVRHRKVVLKQTQQLREKDAASRNDVMRDQAELDHTESQLITARATVRETDAQFVVIEKQRESEMADRQATISLELATARQQYNDVREDLIKARRASELVVLYVPNDHPEYKVIEIADRSQMVQAGEPIMRLIPLNVDYEVEIKVESKDIALIRDSEDGEPKKVRIKLSSYPYMKHGTLDGLVKTINENITEEGQPGMSRSFYYVRVQILRGENDAKLNDVPDGDASLRPGMGAIAEIKVGRRRVLDYFIYPLRRSLDSSIREP